MVETLLELLLHEAYSVAKDVSIKNKEAELSRLHALIMRLLEDPKVDLTVRRFQLLLLVYWEA